MADPALSCVLTAGESLATNVPVVDVAGSSLFLGTGAGMGNLPLSLLSPSRLPSGCPPSVNVLVDWHCSSVKPLSFQRVGLTGVTK